MLKNPDLWLRKGADRRLRAGHCWIYSNEVDTKQSPLKTLHAGQLVNVRAACGDLLCSAYAEPDSLICAHRLSASADVTVDASFFRHRLQVALALREAQYPDRCYRLIYGDSDDLSGLVIDRFNDYLVVQANTAGAEKFVPALTDALIALLEPRGILLRNDSRSRRQQGLEDGISCVYGEVPEAVELRENGVRFLAPVRGGQKTGWFYDHRDNRALLRPWVVGRRVLDVYSYIGGWGVQAAAFGASEVTLLDSSAFALEQAMANAELNGVADKVSSCQGQATDEMSRMHGSGELFDVVILDPPAFIPRKRDLGKGRKAYRRINELGMKLLKPGGLLVSGSCFMHLPEADLIEAAQGAAQRCQRRARVIATGRQGGDHPLHPAIPETRYLKAIYSRITAAD